MTTTSLEIAGIRLIHYPPRRGEHYLSVNLALVGLSQLCAIATELGFDIQVVQLIKHGDGIEIHALLFFELVEDHWSTATNLDDRIDRLADVISPDAIKHCYGGRRQ